jgi:hypothetical protein
MTRERRSERSDQPRLDVIGLDVSGRGRGRRSLIGWPVVIAALLLALGVAALRVDLIRMRYALADGLATEQELLEQQRQLTDEMRRLRDPSGLAKRARDLGFVHPERVIDLPAKPVPTSEADTALALGASRP